MKGSIGCKAIYRLRYIGPPKCLGAKFDLDVDASRIRKNLQILIAFDEYR